MIVVSPLLNFLTNLSFRLYHSIILPLRYRVTIVGGERIGTKRTDDKGGILFLPSHPSHLDASMVGHALWERGIKVHIWTVDYVYKHIFTRFAVRSADTVKLLKVPNVFESRSIKHASKARKLIQKTVEKLRKGENVLFFPAGKQKHTAYEEVWGKSAVERILKLYPNVNIVIVTINGMWGSRFSKAVARKERSELKGQGFMRFMWNILSIMFLNLLFFIPKRSVAIEFQPAQADFPRQGSRKQINCYLQEMINRGNTSDGEPLQKVSDYFWKTSYPDYEYHLKSYRYDPDQIPASIRSQVFKIVAEKAMVPLSEITDSMHLTRDLSLDSLETTEILCELEKQYSIPKYAPKHVTTVGHLAALVARIPVDYRPLQGTFPQIVEEPPSIVRAWHVCTSFILGLFSYLDSQR